MTHVFVLEFGRDGRDIGHTNATTLGVFSALELAIKGATDHHEGSMRRFAAKSKKPVFSWRVDDVPHLDRWLVTVRYRDLENTLRVWVYEILKTPLDGLYHK